MNISFIDYLCLNEDAAAELSNLTIQRQQLIMKKAAANKQLDQQIANIDRLIMQKERQKQAEDQRNGVQQDQQQQAPQQQSNQTQQPGRTGVQTPGSASSVGNNTGQQVR